MKFKIYANEGVMFAANILFAQLLRLGHEPELVREVIEGDETIYIIYCAMNVGNLPKNYIVYQTEYSNSHWFSKRYFEVIKGAICVWEHSPNNVISYKRFNQKVAIVSAGVVKEEIAPVKDIPVLFYGYLKGSQRRQQLLDSCVAAIHAKGIPVMIETNAFCNDIWSILKRTQVVLNIHYYPGNAIEQFRVNEALSFGCHVASEKSVYGDSKYENLVIFWKEPKLMANAVEFILKELYVHADLSRLDNLEEVREALKLI